MDNFEALPHLIGKASVVDFERFWGWCTRWQVGDGGVRFRRPLGEIGMEGKMMEKSSKTMEKTMEKLREWKDKINRTDWSSRARCVMGREGWREERAWLGRAFWGEALLGGCWEAKDPAGWRLQMAADAWGWEEGGAWPGVHVVGMVAAGQARRGRTIWGNYASRSGTVGAGGARLDRDWMAIGITLNLSNSSFPPLPPTPPLPFRAPLRSKTSLKEPAIPLPQTRSSPFPYH